MTHSIKCGHCKGRHITPRDVYFCASGPHAVRNVGAASAVSAPPAPRWPIMAPQELVTNIREGRYAASPSDEVPLTFIRISRPTHGKKKDCFIIQTQHSDELINRLVVYPSGRIWSDGRPGQMAKLSEVLILVAIDEVNSALTYSREIGRCSRCAKRLTDERSRYYGIGPECEQYWPDLIEYVENKFGTYYPGKAR